MVSKIGGQLDIRLGYRQTGRHAEGSYLSPTEAGARLKVSSLVCVCVCFSRLLPSSWGGGVILHPYVQVQGQRLHAGTPLGILSVQVATWFCE